MYEAMRRFKLRGVVYNAGDMVPDLERSPNRRYLVMLGKVRRVEGTVVGDDGTEAEPEKALEEMSRAELNARAEELGIDNPARFGSKAEVIEAIEEVETAPDGEPAATDSTSSSTEGADSSSVTDSPNPPA